MAEPSGNSEVMITEKKGTCRVDRILSIRHLQIALQRLIMPSPKLVLEVIKYQDNPDEGHCRRPIIPPPQAKLALCTNAMQDFHALRYKITETLDLSTEKSTYKGKTARDRK